MRFYIEIQCNGDDDGDGGDRFSLKGPLKINRNPEEGALERPVMFPQERLKKEKMGNPKERS